MCVIVLTGVGAQKTAPLKNVIPSLIFQFCVCAHIFCTDTLKRGVTSFRKGISRLRSVLYEDCRAIRPSKSAGAVKERLCKSEFTDSAHGTL